MISLCRSRQRPRWQWRSPWRASPGAGPRRTRSWGPHTSTCLCTAGWRTGPGPRLRPSSAGPVWRWPLSRTPAPPSRSSRGRRAGWRGPGWWRGRRGSWCRILIFPRHPPWGSLQLSWDPSCLCCRSTPGCTHASDVWRCLMIIRGTLLTTRSLLAFCFWLILLTN